MPIPPTFYFFTLPHEQNNIFGKPGTEKITKQLQRELDKYRKTLAVDEY